MRSDLLSIIRVLTSADTYIVDFQGMKFMRTLFILLVIYSFAFFNVSANANDTFPAQPQMLKVSSSLLTESANFKVTLPASYHSNTYKRYVVLVDLHPRSHGYLAGMEDWMSHNGGWPWLETIIVTAPDGHAGLGELKSLATKQQENQQFLDFMEQDLLPAIDK
ncbi:MAG: hypothetical protein J6N68_05575, partial [Shewanella sp.]|nr:hypothetical protein [Shewanella sp.]